MLAVLVTVVACGTVPPPPPPPTTSPVTLIDPMASQVGWRVVDLEDGREVASHNADQGFIPASTAKVATMVAALTILGPEHHFATRLVATGPIRDGVLLGDLVLVGGGDPLLAPDGLMALAGDLESHGIKTVSGRFLHDASALPATAAIETSQPEDAGYNPGLAALSVDFNRILVRWQRNGEMLTARAVTPEDLRIEKATDGSRFRYRDGRWLAPREGPSRGQTWLPVKDPAARAARLFRELAAMRGITLPGPLLPGRAPANSRVLATHLSPSLERIAAAGLEFSNNLVAELVGLAAARKLAGSVGSLAASAEILTDWYRRRLPKVDWSGFFLPNHSGLSATARVSPSQMTAILELARQEIPNFLTLLPAAGWNQAFNDRLGDSETALRAWAKTGTMNYGSGMVGYLFPRSGHPLAFALYVSDLERRRRHDRTPDQSGAEDEAKRWLQRAKALEEDMVSRWIRPTPDSSAPLPTPPRR